ncbi:hypothetical protein IC006_1751 [Sulfuracidifex tepidarius]|uniref:Zinc-ribbon domain-containing protein n=2 Tax=Sulfuracidifex tepidarius TaxID=1294262 RepID=A0A510E3U8_9CREN|nr:hypothetical protein IC006_1751 [Sulfuracidifex tepidarius]BBG27193.1 hypothetical protein IC007_1729 [Sulfuracidifex tepidarius]
MDQLFKLFNEFRNNFVMEKVYSGRYVNLASLAQEINSIFVAEGWESMVQPMMPAMQAGQYADYMIRATKKGHMHHVEEAIVRVAGTPNDFRLVIEEEHMGALGRELLDRKLLKTVDKEINDGLFDMPMMPQQTQPMMPQPQTQAKCPQCGAPLPPGSRFCSSCGAKLM